METEIEDSSIQEASCDEDEEADSDSPQIPVLRFQGGPPVVESTSSETYWSQTISPTLARRMDKYIYKDGRRCLIENILDDGSLHYVHCLSRHLDSRRASVLQAVNDLEFAWGMKRGTLNLDTRWNVFCVSAKFKALWEETNWILLPEDHILEHYHTTGKKGQKFPDIGEGPYKYRFCVDSNMKPVAIHRQITFPDKRTDGPKAQHFIFNSFPFATLGTLTSHIHPKFVICHVAARTVRSASSLVFRHVAADRSVLSPIIRCAEIVSFWSPCVGEVASNNGGFLESQIDPDDVFSETSDRTANCRLRPHVSGNHMWKGGYVYVKEGGGVKFRHKEDFPHLLTAKSLRIFEEQMEPFQSVSASREWEAIEYWRSNISVDTAEPKSVLTIGRGDHIR